MEKKENKQLSNLEKAIKAQKLTDDEIKLLVKQIKQAPKDARTYNHYYGGKRSKFLVFSDTHIGSKYFREDIFDNMLKVIKKEKVDAVYHCGDIIEGHSNREGHIFELDTIGTSAQLNLAAEYLNQIDKPMFYITGNHDEWGKKKASQGIIVGEELERRLKNAEWLGEYKADIHLAKNVLLRLTHEGNSAYALSYSGQKRINSLQSGTKPNIIMNGHLHKSLFMNYRNINYLEAGALQEQTPFMAMKGSPAMTGFWVLDVSHNKKGITKLKQEWHSYY